MTDRTDQGFAYLSPVAAGLGALFARPKWIAATCVVVLVGLGWLTLGLMTAGMDGAFGAFDAFCWPVVGQMSAGDISVVALMWTAMVLAMMLPSAAPMILTYAEIADTAARKGSHVVSPLMLAAGYTTIWLGFAAFATAAQLTLARFAFLNSGMAAASGLFAGAIFVAAGLYQFSALKHACLNQCRHPLPFFFTNWATTPHGVFRLGVKQGLFCVGCCWAMMLVMFAVGVMNVVWMAGLGIVMAIEKIGTGKWFTYGVGAALIVAGIALVSSGFVAHWPGRGT